MKTRTLLPVIAIGIATTAAGHAAPRPRYYVDDVTVTTLNCPGDPAVVSCAAIDINNGGDIVGSYSTVPYTSHPAVWRDGVMLELETPDDLLGLAHGINEHGDVVGWYGPDDYFYYTPFHWSEATGLTTLSVSLYPGAPFDSHYGGHARAINDHAKIAGDVEAKAFSWLVPMDPCYWSLPTTWSHAFAEPQIDHCAPMGDGMSHAQDINHLGSIVGLELTESGYRGFVSESGAVKIIPPPFLGSDTRGYGINNIGVVVGDAQVLSGKTRAIIWDGLSVNSQSLGVMSGGDFSTARELNNSEFVAGYGNKEIVISFNGNTVLRERAFIWHQEIGMYALPLPAGMLPWTTDCQAHSLNARKPRGDIEVVGSCGRRAVKWTVVANKH